MQNLDNFVVERAEPDNVFETLRSEWRELFAGAGCSPFLSWEWQCAWFRSFGNESEPFIIKTYRDDRLVGILPLCLRRKKSLGVSTARLTFVGDDPGGADYLDLIARPEDRKAVMSANIEFLRANNCFDILALDSLDSESELIAVLQERSNSERRLNFTCTRGAICPGIDLTGGWLAVLKQSKRSSNFKRRLKKLEARPGSQFRSVILPSEIRGAFERFLHLHQLRWADGGSELSGNAHLISFQQELIGSMVETGLLRFDELWVDGECRSSIYGLDDGKTFHYYNTGYDPEWASFSVGLVIIGLSIRNAVERGNLVYDFLRGDETYKFDWANCSRRLVSARLVNTTVPALAAAIAEKFTLRARTVLKTTLPAGITESLKSVERRLKKQYRLSGNDVAREISGLL
ncbi:MAG: GNAT family N-acetyltransferase [Pyrinomonadaceae bacterium]